jgi:hypothetical protein
MSVCPIASSCRDVVIDDTPPLTVGPSLAEMMLTSLAFYVAIFLVSSVWSAFVQKYANTEHGRTIISLAFDAGTIIVI